MKLMTKKMIDFLKGEDISVANILKNVYTSEYEESMAEIDEISNLLSSSQLRLLDSLIKEMDSEFFN